MPSLTDGPDHSTELVSCRSLDDVVETLDRPGQLRKYLLTGMGGLVPREHCLQFIQVPGYIIVLLGVMNQKFEVLMQGAGWRVEQRFGAIWTEIVSRNVDENQTA